MSSESHSLAISIERTLRGKLKCDKSGFGGFVNAEIIEKDPVNSLIIGLASVYPEANQNVKSNIDKYIGNIYQYSGQDIDTIGTDEVTYLYNGFKNLI